MKINSLNGIYNIILYFLFFNKLCAIPFYSSKIYNILVCICVHIYMFFLRELFVKHLPARLCARPTVFQKKEVISFVTSSQEGDIF